ncbi:MAG: hypothetical protein E5V63_25485 [Mesorhizobium sp.]|nr:MAG: hypothetical protein E5V63_25485 [Mesorhizobium sp.]
MIATLEPPISVQIIESVHATAEPTAQPRTDDMREMVDRLRALGQIRRRPSAFSIGDTLIVHPLLMAAMRDRMRQVHDRMAESVFGVGR